MNSRSDTHEHIAEVRRRMGEIVEDLLQRAQDHDASKLEEPELSMFNEFTPRLAEMEADSPEYQVALDEMKKRALHHHYEHNDHHPEHFPNGIADMDLLQVTEMLADWKAASLRHSSGDLGRFIEHAAGRFGYGEEFKRLLLNTAHNLGWL